MPNKKILIVDDDEELHTLYGLYLQGESYQILTAHNGEEALGLLAKEKPAVIVLDMIMPVMGGEGFLSELAHRGLMQDVPVIIASVNDKIPQKFLDMKNVYTFLKKPFSMDILISKIRDAIR